MAVFLDLGPTQVLVKDHVLLCHTDSGRRYTVAFPYQIEQLHCLQDGLIVQCQAGARFHHSQVLGEPGNPSPQRHTFYTLVGHPYNDIYTLGSLDTGSWTHSTALILHTSPRFPLLFAYFPEENLHRLLVLRVNKDLIEREKTSLASLNSTLRDEAVFRYTSSEHYLLTSEAVRFAGLSKASVSVQLYAASQADCLYLAVLQEHRLRLGRLTPARAWTNGPELEDVLSFTLIERDGRPESIQKEQEINVFDDLHSEFQRLISAVCHYLLVLKRDGTIQLLDGLDCICSFAGKELFPGIEASATELEGGDRLKVTFMDGQKRELIRPFEFRSGLVKRCIGALYSVLPLPLYHSIFSDLLRRVLSSRVKSPAQYTESRSLDKSSEFSQLCSLILALVKENRRDPEISPKWSKVDYTDEQRGDWSSAWERLLSSRFHAVEGERVETLLGEAPRPAKCKTMSGFPALELTSSPGALVRSLPLVLHALHMLYEDFKLSVFTRQWSSELAPFLCSLSRLLSPGGRIYEAYYLRDYPNLSVDTAEDSLGQPLEATVPSVQDWLLGLSMDSQPAYLPIMFETTRKVCLLFECLSSLPRSSGPSPFAQHRSSDFVPSVEPDSRSFPLFENSPERPKGAIHAGSPAERFLRTLVEEKVTMATLQAFPLSIRLPALEILRVLSVSPPDSSRFWPRSALELMNRPDVYLTFRREKSTKSGLLAKHSIDQHYEQMLRLELLSEELKSGASSLVQQIFPADLRFEEADSLLNVSRPMKMKVPEYIVSEDQLEAEKQTLLYRLCVRRAATCVGYGALHLGTRKATPTDSSSIPTISLSALIPPNFDTKMTLSSEELNNRDKDFLLWPSFHIGVASALTIFSENANDYIKDRQWINFHKSESGLNEHAGFLLGLGLLGQLDSLDRFDIYKYVEPRQPPFEIAMYLGRAASTAGSMDRMMMGVLSLSLSFLFPPTRDGKVHLPCEAASMLGFGLLYRASANREVTEILLVQMDRKAISNSDTEKESLSLCSGLALGMVNLGLGSSAPGLEDLNLDERLIRLFEGGQRLPPPKLLNPYPLVTEPQNCSVVQEGLIVNTGVTAPGALLAYALIHLKSNSVRAAEQIQLPTSQFLLDYIRPEHALLKVLARNLILWDGVTPSAAWLHSEIPALVSFCFENDLKACRKHCPDSFSSLDFPTIANCYLYCLAGALLSLGFRYMGTCEQSIAQLIIAEVLALRKLKVQVLGAGGECNDANKNNIERQTLVTFLCVGALAASMVMAGTGDVGTFKCLKRVRKLVEQDGGYGGAMAVHMAIGFLFLGAGQYSFANNDFAIAAMLCAVYPKFPVSSADNRYHLQPLRHFYVLAVEKRLLMTVDADTRQPIAATAAIEDIEGRVETLTTPALLKPLNQLRKVTILGEQFYPVTVDFAVQRKLKVYLKRKQGNSSDLSTPLNSLHCLIQETCDYSHVLPSLSSNEAEKLSGSACAFEKSLQSLWTKCCAEQRTDILSFLLAAESLSNSSWSEITAEEVRAVLELYGGNLLGKATQGQPACLLTCEEVETVRVKALNRYSSQTFSPKLQAEFLRFNRLSAWETPPQSLEAACRLAPLSTLEGLLHCTSLSL